MKIRIERLVDDFECDDCGVSYSEGARVFFETVEAFELTPAASCYGGEHYEDKDIYKKILEILGHEVID